MLEERRFPVGELKLLASARSAGQTQTWNGRTLTVEEVSAQSFEGVDLVLASAGGSVSKQWREAITAAGAVMVDNSSAFRMEEGVPLVVPEVNPDAAASGLTSGTTSGTPSSIRKALELSTITAPAAVIASRHCLETEPPADASTRSTPSKDWAETSSTVRVRPFQVWVWPAERADANSFSSPTGKRRSSSNSSSSWPTAPLAPRTATLRGRLGRVEDKRWSERSERKPVVSQIRHHCVENVMPI